MNTDYKVGDLIYDATIYDGLNTFLSDLHFISRIGFQNLFPAGFRLVFVQRGFGIAYLY